jgi:predicted transcriptional regulator
MAERTTVRLPEDLLRRAKRKAAAEGRSLTSLIEDGLRHVVADEHKASKQKRILPRVSSATGGVMPGIDISNSAALQEIEDLEYVERMKHFK